MRTSSISTIINNHHSMNNSRVNFTTNSSSTTIISTIIITNYYRGRGRLAMDTCTDTDITCTVTVVGTPMVTLMKDQPVAAAGMREGKALATIHISNTV